MKKFLVFLILIFSITCFTSCRQKTNTETQNPTVEVTQTPEVTIAPTVEVTPTPEPTIDPTVEVTPTPEPTIDPTVDFTPTPDNPNLGDKTPTIYLAGDSTVKTYEDDQYIAGWGQYLGMFLNENVNIKEINIVFGIEKEVFLISFKSFMSRNSTARPFPVRNLAALSQ